MVNISLISLKNSGKDTGETLGETLGKIAGKKKPPVEGGLKFF